MTTSGPRSRPACWEPKRRSARCCSRSSSSRAPSSPPRRARSCASTRPPRARLEAVAARARSAGRPADPVAHRHRRLGARRRGADRHRRRRQRPALRPRRGRADRLRPDGADRLPAAARGARARRLQRARPRRRLGRRRRRPAGAGRHGGPGPLRRPRRDGGGDRLGGATRPRAARARHRRPRRAGADRRHAGRRRGPAPRRRAAPARRAGDPAALEAPSQYSGEVDAPHPFSPASATGRRRVRRADPGAGAGVAGDRLRRARAAVGADRLGQDAGRVSCGRWTLSREPSTGATRLVYVSPLKALSYDIERNLRAPLRAIGGDTTVAIRTGDTPAARTRGDAPPPARHPHHDAGVAVPDAHLAGARDARRRRAP